MDMDIWTYGSCQPATPWSGLMPQAFVFCKTRPVEIKNEVLAKHLNLWKNQGEFLAISVPYEAFRGDCSAGKSKKHICIWFRKSAIDKLVNYKI